MTALFKMLRKVNFIASIPDIMFEILYTCTASYYQFQTKCLGLTTKTLIAAHISGDVTSKF